MASEASKDDDLALRVPSMNDSSSVDAAMTDLKSAVSPTALDSEPPSIDTTTLAPGGIPQNDVLDETDEVPALMHTLDIELRRNSDTLPLAPNSNQTSTQTFAEQKPPPPPTLLMEHSTVEAKVKAPAKDYDDSQSGSPEDMNQGQSDAQSTGVTGLQPTPETTEPSREVFSASKVADLDDDDDGIVIRPRSRSKRNTLSTAAEDEDEHAAAKKARIHDHAGTISQETAVTNTVQSNDDDDDEGNTKVDEHGALKGDRTYTSKAFRLPMRGDTYYFLATEIARVSGYRDSYLLFNKNRNLKKLMTTEAEKAFLIQQELIPYSYRNRQIGVVKALSIYKTFGSRVIVKGMRVKDDYFAQRARDQGFTEEDYANDEDRPVEDRLHAQAEAQRRADTDADIALANNAKSTVDYNAMINEQRKERMLASRLHFRRSFVQQLSRVE